MLFRGESGREELPQTLINRGAHVDCISAYRRLPPRRDRLAAELAAGCDGIIISSSEAAQHLFCLAGDRRGNSYNHSCILRHMCALRFWPDWVRLQDMPVNRWRCRNHGRHYPIFRSGFCTGRLLRRTAKCRITRKTRSPLHSSRHPRRGVHSPFRPRWRYPWPHCWSQQASAAINTTLPKHYAKKSHKRWHRQTNTSRICKPPHKASNNRAHGWLCSKPDSLKRTPSNLRSPQCTIKLTRSNTGRALVESNRP